MTRLNKIFAAFLILSISSSVFAKPSPETVKEVLEFYYNGKGQGAVLVDTLLCNDVAREGENKNDCVGPIDGDVTVGESVYVWMLYMVPQGEKVNNILLQANYKGLTRSTKDIDLVGSIRYRTWKKVNLNRAGTWELKIIEDADDVTVLKSITVNVVEAQAAVQ